MSKMSKSGISVGYLDTKDQVEKGIIWLHIQHMINLKIFLSMSKLSNALEILNDYRVSHSLI